MQSLFDSSKCQTTHPNMVVIVLDGEIVESLHNVVLHATKM